MDSLAGNKAVVRRHFDAMNQKRPEVWEQIMVDEFTLHPSVVRPGRSHLGDFLGIAPSGRSYAKHGLALYRVEQDRLVEAWFQEDDAAFQQQLFGRDSSR